jgi:3-oxoacyl-[acyl-carrier-protein] synthase III
MNPIENSPSEPAESPSFFARPQARVEQIAIGKGIPLGIEQVSNPAVGIGGAYGTWGYHYDNQRLPELLESRLGEPLAEAERMNLAELGFEARHHLPDLSPAEHLELELEVGARFLQAAAQACGWQPEEVEGVLVGLSGPAADDYTEQIARRAGIPDEALKVSIHKACDGSVAGLHLALNPHLPKVPLGTSIAEALLGKKVLVGGIEGLSRFIRSARDKNALQLFGNGAGVIGIVPGEALKFLVGRTFEAFDEEGVLAVRMYYPYHKERSADGSLVEISQPGAHHIRVAGLMHEPEGEAPVVMAGPMGMVKLFVRSGVQVVKEVYQNYRNLMDRLGDSEKSIAVAIVHHANYKINKLKEKHLQKEGIELPMPWLLSEFGNVSAASNMIAFLRKLTSLRSGDHVLFDGFGAGTYYDALVVEMGG